MKKESMYMGYHNAVLLVWIRNLSGLFNSVGFFPVTSGGEHQVCVSNGWQREGCWEKRPVSFKWGEYQFLSNVVTHRKVRCSLESKTGNLDCGLYCCHQQTAIKKLCDAVGGGEVLILNIETNFNFWGYHE